MVECKALEAHAKDRPGKHQRASGCPIPLDRRREEGSGIALQGTGVDRKLYALPGDEAPSNGHNEDEKLKYGYFRVINLEPRGRAAQ